jgi:hypothetical protein
MFVMKEIKKPSKLNWFFLPSHQRSHQSRYYVENRAYGWICVVTACEEMGIELNVIGCVSLVSRYQMTSCCGGLTYKKTTARCDDWHGKCWLILKKQQKREIEKLNQRKYSINSLQFCCDVDDNMDNIFLHLPSLFWCKLMGLKWTALVMTFPQPSSIFSLQSNVVWHQQQHHLKVCVTTKATLYWMHK